MSGESPFHVLTVGWPRGLIEDLAGRIAARSPWRFSHLAHPRHSAADWPAAAGSDAVRYFRSPGDFALPQADPDFLTALEGPGVPTIHNMILGDRVLAKLDYGDVLRYATFVARRIEAVYEELGPSVVIGGFDSLHGGLSLAVAKRAGIPWFALHFSVIPPGLACFCDGLSPAARVQLATGGGPDPAAAAEEALRRFETRDLKAYAYIPPRRGIGRSIARLPERAAILMRTIRARKGRDFARFTEEPTRYSSRAALAHLRRSSDAYRALSRLSGSPPRHGPYVLFGLHTQPESSIDVWAPFFSNQMWVIETLSRCIPPTHRLLVKIHKSDVSRYAGAAIDLMRSFPGVEVVHPSADSRDLLERAALVVSIQGTMGLEAALLGRPVLLLGDSPVAVFPSAARAAALADLAGLVRELLARPTPSRDQILAAFAAYLAPFMPACHNDWRVRKSEAEVEGLARMFDALRDYLRRAPRPDGTGR